jgi:hypothetical protein
MAHLLSVPPRWMTLRAVTEEGRPVVVLIDEAVALSAPYDGFGVQVGLGLQLGTAGLDGLPGPQEKDALRAFEQTMVDAIGSTGRLVASITMQGVREYLIYASTTSWAQEWAQTPPEGMRSHTYGLQAGEDPHWHGLRQMAGIETPPQDEQV